MANSVLRLHNISKRFGPVWANKHISLELEQGRVLALLGENGAGKTTLMSILFGHYVADEGDIDVFGQRLTPGSPAAAIAAGVGMVHQHFTLADNLTVLENVILGAQRLWSPRLRTRQARAKLAALAREFGLAINPDARVGALSIGERQRVELLKALYRGAKILILDEPTAVLTPQETETLFATLRGMVAQGLSVIFISHKLNEALAIAGRIAVLRQGEIVADFERAQADRQTLAAAMVGRAVAEPKRQPLPPGAPVLELDKLSIRGHHSHGALHDITLTVHAHEIVGIAGVSGNGQGLLADVLNGLYAPDAGTLRLAGEALGHGSAAHMVAAGVGRIPEDRHGSGVIGDMSVAENLILEDYRRRFSRFGWLRSGAILAHAKRLINAFDVRCAGPDAITRSLSGGNMQKLILARAFEREPALILASQPTRGLDVGAAAYVHEQLFKARARGAGILLIAEDLDELLTLADRVAVIYRGRLSPARPVGEVTRTDLGLLMSGHGDFAEGERAA